ncbi:unnamed protein product [Heterosigma akashiwo]
MRLAFLGYRDLCDGEKQFEKVDFFHEEGHQMAFKSFVYDVAAYGGGDTPEDIAGALKNMLEFSWAFPTRILFHIADAPCHGTNYHSYSRDDHPDGGPDGPFIQQYLTSLDKQGVQYFFARISPSTDKMIEQFNAGMGKAYITTVPLESASELVGTVTTSIRKSIHTSMVGMTGATTVRYGARHKSLSIKNYSISAATPLWASIPAQKVMVFSNPAPSSTDDLKNPSFGLRILRLIPKVNGTKHYEKHIKIAPQPFAKGAIRLAYKGQLQLDKGVRDVILKEFQVAVAEAHSMEKYMAQIEVSSVASFLAEEYNKQKESHLKKVRVLKSTVVKAEHRVVGKGDRLYCMEDPLAGQFVKFCNNTGHWEESRLDLTLLNFSEFTHTVTGGYMMVVDLQGIVTDDKFLLTDPVILCMDTSRFGNTNLGVEAMVRCNNAIRAHKMNLLK